MGERSRGPSPGPWRAIDGLVIDVNGDVVLAFVREANAPLIAAAPQLLAHLQRWHVAAHPRGDDSCETCQFLRAIGQPITTP